MTQLYVGNLSAEGDEKAIRLLFGKYGPVREVFMKNGYSFVEFESPISADEATKELNGSDILGHPMIVELSHQQRLREPRKWKIKHGKVEVPLHLTIQVHVDNSSINGSGMRTASRTSPGLPAPPSNTDFPLRILVPSDMIGVIFGKDGATIKMITQISKARIDVHRKENLGTAEIVITTIGPPEYCTEACYQIMKIMQNEMINRMMKSGKFHELIPDLLLNILAHNELVGRVIGKGGGRLRCIMQESGTKITISNLKDLTALNMERTIIILGTIDNCKKAESLISAKLRASYKSDMTQFTLEQGGFSSTLSPSPTNVPTPNGQGGVGLSGNLGLSSGISEYTGVQPTPSSTNVRTFTDYSGEHTQLATLHSSTGALEVNNFGGFKLGPTSLCNGTTKFANTFESSIDGIVRTTSSGVSTSNGGGGGGGGVTMNDFGQRTSQRNSVTDHLAVGHRREALSKHSSSLSISSGEVSGSEIGNRVIPCNGGNQFHSGMMPNHMVVSSQSGGGVQDGLNEVDDMSDVPFKEPSIVATPGYSLCHSSAPVGNGGDQGDFGAIGNGYSLWGSSRGNEHQLLEVTEVTHMPTSRNSPVQQQFNITSNSFLAGLRSHTIWDNGKSNEGNAPHGTQSIWSQSSFYHTTTRLGEGSAVVGGGEGGGSAPGSNGGNQGIMMGNGSSRPNSEMSSYSDSSILGVSPIYYL